MALLVRPEKPEDFDTIAKINQAAFGQNEEAELVALLRGTESFIPELSLVADLDGLLVGHILFSKARIVGETTTPCLALAPMAVSPSQQGSGIGTALMNKGLAISRALGHQAIVVLGHPHFYPKFGFTPASGFGIKFPQDVPDDVFLAQELTPGALKNATGTIRYDPAFGLEPPCS